MAKRKRRRSWARDKLEEAAFFAGKLKQASLSQPEFRYNLSALLSALRSVPLVLQKDYRGPHQEKFDDWWKGKRQTLPSVPLNFELLRDARNVLQKEGNRLPLVHMEIPLPPPALGLLSNIEVLSRSTSTADYVSISFSMDPDHPLAHFSAPDDVSEEKLHALETDHTMKVIEQVGVALRDIKPANRTPPLLKGIRLGADAETVPVDEFHAAVEDLIQKWRGILAEADELFKSAP